MNIMTKEQLVTRVTAEMLKKAGFDVPCRTGVENYRENNLKRITENKDR